MTPTSEELGDGDVLFPGFEPDPVVAAADTMGVDARRTARQKALISAGIHPATRRVIPDTNGRTCGDCAHLWKKDNRWFKCEVTPYAYDMRKGWPACDQYQPTDTATQKGRN